MGTELRIRQRAHTSEVSKHPPPVRKFTIHAFSSMGFFLSATPAPEAMRPQARAAVTYGVRRRAIQIRFKSIMVSIQMNAS